MLYKYDFFSIVVYPDLRARKLFVHDMWEIAKFTENQELKNIVAKDHFFYMTRDDVFQLIHTEDNQMINLMLHYNV